MYETFYGLRENPFSVTPDPQYIYLGENQREALAQLLYGVQQKKGFIVLTGEVGTGKTTLIRFLLDKLNHGGSPVKTAFLFNPKLTVNDFIESILKDLGIPAHTGTKGDQLHFLYENLIEAYKKKERVVLIIDEAQGLNPALLEEIRLLSNLETAKSKLLQIILVGQPELDETLSLPEFRQLRQRVNMRYHLPPLSREEAEEYIGKRLRIAGAKRSIFTGKALKEIHQRSSGIPRLINILCDNSLLTGYAQDQKVIDKKIVREVSKDLHLEKKGIPQWFWYSAAGAALVLLLAWAAFKTRWSFPVHLGGPGGIWERIERFFTILLQSFKTLMIS
jgi:general secretion pathway protein A